MPNEQPPNNFDAVVSEEPNLSASDTSLALQEQSNLYSNEKIKNDKQNRELRFVAFIFFGLISLLYLVCLLATVHNLLSGQSPLIYYMTKQGVTDWHAWLLLGLILIIFAVIPLSILNGLVKMVSEKTEPEDMKLMLPQIEALKHLIDLLRPK